MEEVRHFGSKQFFELPACVSNDCRSFLSEDIDAACRDAWRSVAFHFVIMFPKFLSVLGIETGQDTWSGESESEFTIADGAGHIGHVILRAPNEIAFGDVAVDIRANGQQ